MGFVAQLAEIGIITGAVLLWARWSKLDLGLRRPILAGVWPWVAIFILWWVVVWVIDAVHPTEVDPEWLEWMEQLSPVEDFVLAVVVAPLSEELIFRGAMFSALIRRWGIWIAAVVPSLLWSLLHLHYDAWLVASIAVSGVVLAIIRWKSRSLYVPVAVHMAVSLVATLSAYPPFAPAE